MASGKTGTLSNAPKRLIKSFPCTRTLDCRAFQRPEGIAPLRAPAARRAGRSTSLRSQISSLLGEPAPSPWPPTERTHLSVRI